MPLEEVPTGPYLAQFGIDLGRPLRSAPFVPTLLSRLSALSPGERDRFVRACFWLQHAHAVERMSVSAAYVAIINAIEALVPSEPGSAACPSCGKPRGKSMTTRFAEFLERYVPAEQLDNAARRELYRIRSRLAHGGDLLRLDVERLAVLHPDQSEVWSLVHGASNIARFALLQWLASHGNEGAASAG